MKTKLTKILIVLILVITSISLVGCKNNNNKPEPPEPIKLPTELKQQKTDEVIFVTLDGDGTLTSLKASNHISDASFYKYQQYGKFANSGHLNITSSQAKIELEEDYALIPSLKDYDNFFYLLNLDKDYYLNKIPFQINIKTKLDDVEVTSKDLKGSTGRVEMTYEFVPNVTAHEYLQKSYAAQVQIPINLNNSNIVEAEGTLSKVLVGQNLTLAYMAMPGQITTIKVVLDVNNFKFDGMQAVFMPIDIMDMAGGMIDLNKLGLDNLEEMVGGFDQLIGGLNMANEQMSPLFENLGQISTLSTALNQETIAKFQELIDGLNSAGIKFAYGLFKLGTSYKENGTPHKPWFETTIESIQAQTTNLTNSFNNLKQALESINLNIEKYELIATKYESAFQVFTDVIPKFLEMKQLINDIVSLNPTEIENLVENKNVIITKLERVDQLLQEIKQNLAYLETTMYLFPHELEEIITSMTSLLESLMGVYESVSNLIPLFTSLSEKITEGLENNWFSDLLAKPTFEGLRDNLVKEDPTFEDPGLIQGLTLIKFNFDTMDISSQAEQIEQLKTLYNRDPETNLRPIDQIYLSFVQINQGLLLPQENQPMSFYDGIGSLVSLKDILKLLPDPITGELPSFLYEKNLSPNSLQFIIKQAGI